ncbi:hypothetical protein PPL_07387 [Heterostelium album PN500]|uniref:Uncharacterized protein n=1 Tax=Heterostelium pallidum (strain ATCC 26659 / Pp 5 / PN500) TaxID=670386 RepID=D3BFT6_HETP5|nr:hypothetical protein PPL_07387 [Heterostelium album PN500]EFA79696.1 hypothetical protein PPL_07387 [Heterostelium album PN500]|eukprot:XP_020431817.1 hypothetical protein PPL_07387 [Heterostelium album PN500]
MKEEILLSNSTFHSTTINYYGYQPSIPLAAIALASYVIFSLIILFQIIYFKRYFFFELVLAGFSSIFQTIATCQLGKNPTLHSATKLLQFGFILQLVIFILSFFYSWVIFHPCRYNPTSIDKEHTKGEDIEMNNNKE